MAGLILNLASLKIKADAAGVGTTATSSTPSLCPPKSTIAGYVTNGASTVIITGTWADNLLVEDASVCINKLPTGSETVYRNVSVGSLQGGDDISAGGGSSRVYKVVSYEYATKTNYSDGTSTTTAYSSASYTVYGSTVSASSLGTTVKSRTYIGTSSATETVAGTSVSVSGDIYLAKNEITSTQTIYSDHSQGNSTASDIPAGGGSVSAYALITYKYCTRSWYTSGSYSDGAKSNGSGYIYGSSVSANSLVKTLKNRASTGKTSTPSGTVGGVYFTGTAVTIYLAANYISSIEATTSEGESTHVKYSNMSASGGTVNPTGTGRCKYTFKSGSTETSGSTNPFTGVTATYTRTYSEYSDSSNAFTVNTSTGAVTAGANSSTSSTRSVTVKAVLTVSISYSSGYSSLTLPSNSTITHYPTCTLNKADGPEPTGGWLYFSGTNPLPDVSYDGGKNLVPTITVCLWVTQYSDGSTSATNLSTSSVTWTYAKYTKNSTYYDASHYPAYDVPTYYAGSSNAQFDLGANTGDRYLKGWVFIKGVYNGSTDYIRREVWLEEGYEDYYITATYNISNIPYYGDYCSRPWLSNIKLVHDLNDSSTTTNLSQSDLTITGYANNNTGTAPSSDSSYTSSGYLYRMSLNASSDQLTGNYIYMRVKYTPSGASLIKKTFSKRVKLDGNPGTGFILTMNNPEGSAAANPVVHLCYGNKEIKYSTGSYLSHQTVIQQSWTNNWTGAIEKIAITRVSNLPAHVTDYKYLTITGYTETNVYKVILQKTDITSWFSSGASASSTSDFMSLTNSFYASDFNSGNYALIIMSFTKT